MTFSLPGAGGFRLGMTDARGPLPVRTAAIFRGTRGKSAGELIPFIDVRLWCKQRNADDLLNTANPHETPLTA
jgi:hypothetical protein